MSEAGADEEPLAPRSAARVAAIKAERARALARRVDGVAEARAAARRGSHLLVRLGRERHAVPLAQVERLAFVPPITPLPGTPPSVAGAASVGGEGVTVVDLARLLGVAPAPASEQVAAGARLLLARCGPDRVAVRVDGVEDAFDPRAIDEVVRLPGSWLGPEHVRGVADGGVLVLDLARVLSDPRLRVDDSEPESEGSERA